MDDLWMIYALLKKNVLIYVATGHKICLRWYLKKGAPPVECLPLVNFLTQCHLSTNTHRLRLLEVVLMQSKGGSVESAFLCFTWDHTSVLLHTVPVTYDGKGMEHEFIQELTTQREHGTFS